MTLVYSPVPSSTVVSYDDFIKCFQASGLTHHFSTLTLKVLYEFYNEQDEDVVLSIKSICDEWSECDVAYFLEEHPEAKEYLGDTVNWEKLNGEYGAILIDNGRITYNNFY